MDLSDFVDPSFFSTTIDRGFYLNKKKKKSLIYWMHCSDI